MSDKLFIDAYMNHVGLAMDVLLNGTDDLQDHENGPTREEIDDSKILPISDNYPEEGLIDCDDCDSCANIDYDDQYEVNDDGQLVPSDE